MKILISDYISGLMPTHDYEISIIKGGFPDAEIDIFEYTDDNREEFLNRISDADALLTAYIHVDKEVFERASKLKVVSISATGFDNVDLAEATKHSVGVCPIGEYCTIDMAEHTMALMLALNKNLKSYAYDIDNDYQWRYNKPEPPTRIGNQTLGIFGFGKIGKAVAKLAQGLGMKVIACDPYVQKSVAEALGVELLSQDEVFERADVISSHMNLDADNKEYFTAKEFNKMKRRPIFLNLARGLSVNENDLADALDKGIVRAAGLDVLREELPELKGHILAGRDNVIITPHAAFYSSQSMQDLPRISSENIVYFLKGEKEKVFKLVNEV